jgi:hypothetical protein
MCHNFCQFGVIPRLLFINMFPSSICMFSQLKIANYMVLLNQKL